MLGGTLARGASSWRAAGARTGSAPARDTVRRAYAEEVDRALVTLRVGPGRSPADEVARVATALRAALDGSGPAVAVLPAPGPTAASDAPRGPDLPAARVPEPVALGVRTSGSTGRPRHVLLDRDALAASAAATRTRLGGPGRWLLALPLDHVAGLQVVARSLLTPVAEDEAPGSVAGPAPAVVAEPADAAALADAVRRERDATDLPLVTSLVPTQLRRAVDAGAATLGALRGLDAILVGGAATPAPLLARARDAGLRVVTTYGMTETCGGCVYDGVPLDGVEVTLDEQGRVLLGGPVLARGYLDDAAGQAAAFPRVAGRRWHRTSDLGSLEGGRLTVLGRADDVVVTGGENVAPAAVEAAVAALGPRHVAEVCVVGVPDAEWGSAVVAVVVPGPEAPALDDVRSAVRRTLGPAAAPRHLVLVDALPLRGPGKVDRAAVARTAARDLGRPGHD